MLVSERIGRLLVEDPAGHRERLEFTEYGSGDAWVVLLPGPLLTRRMHEPLARSLAAGGLHVLSLDPLGQGGSDRPADPLAYSVPAAARHVVALLDHVGAAQAVVGGSSVGANVALTVAVEHPDRVRGLLLESPLLDNGFWLTALTLGPVMASARWVPLPVTALRALTRRVPRGVVPFWLGVALDAADQRPGALAAMLHGLLMSGLAPDAARRRGVRAPALVVGHRHDPWHRLSDARMLAEELPEATLSTSTGPLEWRVRPHRLTMESLEFCRRCWLPPRRRRRAGA